MINKFHKTTYPRGHNFNVVSSSQGKRSALYQQPTDCINPHKVETPLERKIEIESSLLFNQKNYPKTVNKFIESSTRKPNNKSEAKFY